MQTEEVAEKSSMTEEAGEGSLVGKRYIDEIETLVSMHARRQRECLGEWCRPRG